MRWLTEDWHRLLDPPWSDLALVGVAVLCGAVVGFERERREKPAGIRTFILVCLGSAIFSMISSVLAVGSGNADRTRIASQIVVGIGFLGGGAILRGVDGVVGLTTAATIWVVAATGMVVGTGFAGAGLGLSTLILLVLSTIGWIEQGAFSRPQFVVVDLVIDPDGGKTMIRLKEIIEVMHLLSGTIETLEKGSHWRIRLRYRRPYRHHHAFLAKLAGLPEVKGIELQNGASSWATHS